MRRLAFVILFALCFIAGDALHAASEKTIVARVGNTKIRLQDVDGYLRGQPELLAQIKRDPAKSLPLRKIALERLINAELLRGYGAKIKAIDEKRVKKAVEAILQQQGGVDALAKRFAAMEADFYQYRLELARQVRETQTLAKVVKGTKMPELKDELLEEYYRKNRSSYNREKAWELKVLQLDVPSDPFTAGKLRKKLKTVIQKMRLEPELFENSAVDVKTTFGTTGRSGYFGWTRRGRLDPRLEKIVVTLGEPGDISDPVQLGKQLFIFKLINLQQRAPAPALEEVKDEIIRDIRKKQIDELSDDILKKLRADGKVKKFVRVFEGAAF